MYFLSIFSEFIMGNLFNGTYYCISFPGFLFLTKCVVPVLGDFIDITFIFLGTIEACGNVGKHPYSQKVHADVFRCEVPCYSVSTLQWLKIEVCVCVCVCVCVESKVSR